jgi:hypothetical protein
MLTLNRSRIRFGEKNFEKLAPARTKSPGRLHLRSTLMGKLIVMPSRNIEEETVTTPLVVADQTSTEIDFSVWTTAPRERTGAYFPTYSAVSKAIQTAMRGWVREWFSANMEILQKPHAAYSVLVYQCTHPFSGRPTNIFTYEIQQTETLHKAFRSAANKLGRYLKSMDTKRLSWFTREHYFAYRSKEVVTYVYKNPRALYRMLHVETMLMDAILRFSIIDLPTIGMEDSLARLRRTFRVQLHRFSDQFDLSPHAEELLRIATDTLVSKMAADAVALLLQVA